MKMLCFLIGLVISMYLRTALIFGCHRYVFRTIKKWDPERGTLSSVTRSIRQRLFRKGYHNCPFCFQMTEKNFEHVESGEGYCYKKFRASLPECMFCHAKIEFEGAQCDTCDAQHNEMMRAGRIQAWIKPQDQMGDVC